MPRRKRNPTHENHERWMVSYADFVTLLFAFFVVMFASSQHDKEKARQVEESVRQAIEAGGIGVFRTILGKPGAGQRVITPKPVPAPVTPEQPDLLPSLQYLDRTLRKDIDEGKIDVSFQHRGIVISLRAAAFFPSGDDHIDQNMYKSMETIARVVKDLPNPVRLEGHTDSVPIHNTRFRSNWELSAARAIAVMDLFNQLNIPPGRFVIAGYAENLPVDSNETEAGRAHNRRVDVVILSSRAVVDEKQGRASTAAPAGGS